MAEEPACCSPTCWPGTPRSTTSSYFPRSSSRVCRAPAPHICTTCWPLPPPSAPCRTGRATSRSRCPRKRDRAGSAQDANGCRCSGDERGHAALPTDARDDDRPRARGDPAVGQRLLHDALRDAGTRPTVARLLPGTRSDVALRAPSDAAQGDAVSARRSPLAAQIAAAPRATAGAGQGLPRRLRHIHPPRPRAGGAVDAGDAHLQRAHVLLAGAGEGDRGDLDRPAGADARRAGPRSRHHPTGPLDRRPLRRVHGRRARGRRAGVPASRRTAGRRCPRGDRRLSGGASTWQTRHGCDVARDVRPRGARPARAVRAIRRAFPRMMDVAVCPPLSDKFAQKIGRLSSSDNVAQRRASR